MRTFARIALAIAALQSGTALAQQSFAPPPVQAISASSLPLPTGAATAANQATGNTSLGTIATALANPLTVSGTVTANISGSISNTSFGISGTLPAFAATPTVNIGTAPSIAVTGTFWQTTQPVSIATMPSTPVTGTFWQSTQPVSGAASGFADGWDVTQGSKGDAAWTSGSGSAIALLKAIDRDMLLPLAAGANVVGGVTIADGSDASLGAKADAAYAGSGSASLIGVNKGIYAALVAPLPGAVTTAAPAYSTGTTNSLSLTTGGALRGDLSSYAGTALTGTVTAYGTAPTGNVFGVNAAVTNTVAVSAASLPLPTGAATGVAQASTTSGQSGALVQGAVTTAAPAYTTAQTSPLSLTTAGSLRSDLSSINGSAIAVASAQLGVNIAQVGNSAVSQTAGVLAINIAKWGGTTIANTNGMGSVNSATAVTISSAVSQVDQNATAFAGAGNVNGTVVASSQGGGAAVSAEINVSALTLGTASSVIFCLTESTGGTNFSDIWCSDPVTATGITRVPATPVAGRRKWRAFSVGGTSTTVTTTITSLELPAGYPVQRQFRDAYAATNPFATQYNSAAQTASNFVLGTGSTATTPFYIEGTKQITAFMTLAGSPTVTTQPVVTLQLSMDGSNWATVAGATLTAAGNGTYLTSSQSIGGAKFARLQVTTAAAYSSGAYTISNIGVNAVN